MNRKVLVAYATKHGATAEIAQKIGEILHEEGFIVGVHPVQDVDDLSPYSAVILGSAVYIGNWRKEAVKFLEDNEQKLKNMDTWLFSSGPTGEGDPEALLQGWTFPQGQQEIADRINPHSIVVFHGALEPDKLNILERFLIKNVKAPSGDFRDWQSIEDWAEAIAEELKTPVV